MTEDTLTAWARALAEALELDVTNVDVNALLDVAADAAHSRGEARGAAHYVPHWLRRGEARRER